MVEDLDALIVEQARDAGCPVVANAHEPGQ
jgi:hypothetical protein